jgi:hypothetical protein
MFVCTQYHAVLKSRIFEACMYSNRGQSTGAGDRMNHSLRELLASAEARRRRSGDAGRRQLYRWLEAQGGDFLPLNSALYVAS